MEHWRNNNLQEKTKVVEQLYLTLLHFGILNCAQKVKLSLSVMSRHRGGEEV
jgi:hypothetical protein